MVQTYCPIKNCFSQRSDKCFYLLPANEELRTKWVELCCLKGISKTSQICEMHFDEEDFYFSTTGKKKLRRRSLPSTNLPTKLSDKGIPKFLTPVQIVKDPRSNIITSAIVDQRTGKPVQRLSIESTQTSALVKKLQKQVQELKSEKASLMKKNATLIQQNGKLRKHSLLKKDVLPLFKKYLGKYFTDAQIKAYLRGDWKAIRNWTTEDFKRARILRLISKRAYQYMRKNNILPLPSLTTLYKAFPNGITSPELTELLNKYDVDDDKLDQALNADLFAKQDQLYQQVTEAPEAPLGVEQVQQIQYVQDGDIIQTVQFVDHVPEDIAQHVLEHGAIVTDEGTIIAAEGFQEIDETTIIGPEYIQKSCEGAVLSLSDVQETEQHTVIIEGVQDADESTLIPAESVQEEQMITGP